MLDLVGLRRGECFRGFMFSYFVGVFVIVFLNGFSVINFFRFLIFICGRDLYILFLFGCMFQVFL